MLKCRLELESTPLLRSLQNSKWVTNNSEWQAFSFQRKYLLRGLEQGNPRNESQSGWEISHVWIKHNCADESKLDRNLVSEVLAAVIRSHKAKESHQICCPARRINVPKQQQRKGSPAQCTLTFWANLIVGPAPPRSFWFRLDPLIRSVSDRGTSIQSKHWVQSV